MTFPLIFSIAGSSFAAGILVGAAIMARLNAGREVAAECVRDVPGSHRRSPEELLRHTEGF